MTPAGLKRIARDQHHANARLIGERAATRGRSAMEGGGENGEIYKMELNGKVLGRFGTAGKLAKEFGTVNEIDCRKPNVLYVGEPTNCRVQKLTLHP
jgi:hypothetical protein